MKYKLIFVIAVICILLVNANNIYALDFINDVIHQGNNFEDMGNDTGLGTKLAEFLNGDIKAIISLIGNLVFAIVTVMLGAKYIWSGVEGKSQVKETLPNFLAAVIFFYLAVEITNLFSPNTAGSIGSDLSNVQNYNNLASSIIGTVNLIVKYLAFAGVLFIGLKYMYESAEEKAKIKERLVPMVLGIVLVFCASSFVDFIIAVGQQTIN